MQSSEYVHSTTSFLLATSPERSKTKQVNLGLVLLFCAMLSLSLAACTSAAGIGGASSGWSPVAAIAIPLDTGSRINEGRNIEPPDNFFTVTNVDVFKVGQVLLLGQERLKIISIREQDLVVTRGVDGTRPQTHNGGATIYTVGDRFEVFVTTKQGDIKALKDDGLDSPVIQWICQQEEC